MYTAAVARHLAGLGLVAYDEAGADCFLEDLPTDPVDAVGVYTIPGGGDTLEPWGWVSLQLIVRASGDGGRAREGFDRAADLRAAMHGLRHVTLADGTEDELRLLWCKAASRAPVSLGEDADHHVKWSVRLDLYVVLATAHTIS